MNNKTLRASLDSAVGNVSSTNLLTFTGPTAPRTITLPDAAFSVARKDAAQTFSGVQTFTSVPVVAGLQFSALSTAPASAGATGTTGEIRVASGFVYVCVATNTWQRAAIATW